MSEGGKVAKTFYQARIKAGLTVRELAEKAGVGSRTINRIESGEVEVPRFGTVRRIAPVVGEEPWDLMHPDGDGR